MPTAARPTRIARDAGAAAVLAGVGIHSYLAIPLTARGRPLGVLGLMRGRNQLPFDADDVTLAGELADRTAVSLDNSRLYQSVRNTAVTLQRSLLPSRRRRRVWRSPPATNPPEPLPKSVATGSTSSPSRRTRPRSWWAM